MAFLLESSAFSPNGSIPTQYTCEGGDRCPPLNWSAPPAGTKSFALVVDDPDAPDPNAPKMRYVHWVLYNIPATATSLAESAKGSILPPGTEEGINDWKRTGYGGPCPPIGQHRYFFKLYALDTVLPKISPPPTRSALEQAMEGHILGQTELIGLYRLQKKQ